MTIKAGQISAKCIVFYKTPLYLLIACTGGRRPSPHPECTDQDALNKAPQGVFQSWLAGTAVYFSFVNSEKRETDCVALTSLAPGSSEPNSWDTLGDLMEF